MTKEELEAKLREEAEDYSVAFGVVLHGHPRIDGFLQGTRSKSLRDYSIQEFIEVLKDEAPEWFHRTNSLMNMHDFEEVIAAALAKVATLDAEDAK
jgi:hypothetical protein